MPAKSDSIPLASRRPVAASPTSSAHVTAHGVAGSAGAATVGATEAVFDALVADIVRGTYPPGTRLPAERELAPRLGASRPTLREALRRLDEWNMVVARRGSGIVVRDQRDWMIEALPAYLRHAHPAAGRPSIAQTSADILHVRRMVMIDLLRLLAGRVPPGGTAAARAHAERAWQLRGDGAAFAREDFQVIRALADAAGSLPAMWMINRLSGVYLDIASSIAGAIAPPADYLDVYGHLLGCVDLGDVAAAAATLEAYLERHDRVILTLLEQMG